MNTNNGIVRGRYRFAEWTLSSARDAAVRHFGKCLTCGERSADTPESDTAQVWCLKHAGATRHPNFELSVFQYFNAAMTNPAAEGTPPT